ncbi:MAG: PEP-CTERM sorting domain-containing protein [bacterium]|nr:PEP-CTERM sorting domain-containing protein [bacterium]
MVYKKSHAQPFKWLLAILIFMLVMSVTFSDVHGFQVNSSNDNSEQAAKTNNEVSYSDVKPNPDNSLPPEDNPGSSTMPVPEPGTLVMVIGGLTAIYTARRLRQRAQ